MNIIKNSALLPGITLILLSGCANVQNNPLYMAWQDRAYSAYGMPAPAPTSNPYMSATMPYYPSNNAPLAYMPQQGYISQAIPVSAPASPAELQYIARYYGL